MTAKDKRPLLLYFTDSEEVFAGWAVYFIFSLWSIINHKDKCIQAKTFDTQVSWSLDPCTH